MADIVIVNPRFNTSFWGMEHCMAMLGKRANLPVACLPLLAALVPRHHQVTIIDENVEELDFERLEQADMVCITGMSVQGARVREILEELNTRNIFTVVGGPMATVEPEELEELADVIFVGEADVTWPQFIKEWESGRHACRYEQLEKTDMTSLPLPRLDLLKSQHYMFGSMQISRGCPFTCEFCDIIVTFGRKPRLKGAEQVLAELDAYYRAGIKIVFVVDDNLIGNKKAIKPMLREIAEWQEAHSYALTLFTEASLDLAEDEELMCLMGRAGFQSVFIGIESPDEASLKETKKMQNVRERAGTLVERVRRIQDHGLDVWCGMIVGFDNDKPQAFEVLPGFLADARIANALIGLLHAIPTTPLFERLKSEGRLNDDAGSDAFGTNVIPLGMSPAMLRDGLVRVTEQSYSANAYFERLDKLFVEGGFKFAVHQLPYWRTNRLAWLWSCVQNYIMFAVLAVRLVHQVEDATIARRYRTQLLRVFRRRTLEPQLLFTYAIKTAMHHHYATITKSLVESDGGPVPESVRSFSRAGSRRQGPQQPLAINRVA
ncbi:B12-binding domain-containing radical SAM protein [Hyphomicrobium sp. MC1]|uniref:B12-binding domain-containing radical SAM protein n=1 Tax=Hyphomicrobium sp. (strain MC1) TaxID=717785 RepID=UPI000213D831|nr:radical SAM protein [Hyphomicrobium sp. MC1]CCB65067.1 putative methyltransferase [Hyphomicrobium sp. MC1]